MFEFSDLEVQKERDLQNPMIKDEVDIIILSRQIDSLCRASKQKPLPKSDEKF